MRRQLPWMTLVTCALAMAWGGDPAGQGQPARPPNVLLIMADDLNFDLGT